MKPKSRPKVSKAIADKARQALEFAQTHVAECGRLAGIAFRPVRRGRQGYGVVPDRSRRLASSRTAEYKQIFRLLDQLPRPTEKETSELISSANGAISVRLPRSVHAALLAEAKAEGVSLNQLCVAKLVAQLRTVV